MNAPPSRAAAFFAILEVIALTALAAAPFAAIGAVLAAPSYGASVAWGVLAISFLVTSAARGELRSPASAAIRATQTIFAIAPLYGLGALVGGALFLAMLFSMEGGSGGVGAVLLPLIPGIGLFGALLYMPAAVADGHGPRAALRESFRVAREGGVATHLALCVGILVALVASIPYGPVVATAVVAAATVVASFRYARRSAAPPQSPERAWRRLLFALLGLELVAALCISVLSFSVPPPEDLGPVTDVPRGVREVIHPSGDTSRLVSTDGLYLERVAPDGTVRAKMPMRAQGGLDHIALAASGERVVTASIDDLGHYITLSDNDYVPDKKYLDTRRSTTVALEVYHARTIQLEREPSGFRIRIIADGFIPLGPHAYSVFVPDVVDRASPSSALAAMAPRYTALLDIFPGALVALPLMGPAAGLLFLIALAAPRLRKRPEALVQAALWALLFAAVSAAALWLAAGFGM